MIYTLTLNPSIDYIVQTDTLTLGEVNRAKHSMKFPGGKGINVSRILSRLNIDNTALGFLGGFTGEFVTNWLKNEGIQTTFTSIQDDTRINVKLRAEEETEINGASPVITALEKQALEANFEALTENDTVVLAGSIPASLGSDYYQHLIKKIKAQGAQFVIDTTGQALEEALEAKPLVVKPNHHELAELYHTKFDTIEDIFPYGRDLLKKGAQHVLISMAGDGALFFTGDHIYQAKALKGILKNSVGAGDSMIAGFVGAFTQTQDPLEAFKMGVACGSATAFSDDLATKDFIQEYYEQVVIEQLT